MRNYSSLLGTLPALALSAGLLIFGLTNTRTVRVSTMSAANAAQIRAPRPGFAKYEPARGVYLGAALDYSNLTGDGAVPDKMSAAMQRWETQAGRKHAIYLQFEPFPHDDGAFPTWDSDPQRLGHRRRFLQRRGGCRRDPPANAGADAAGFVS